MEWYLPLIWAAVIGIAVVMYVLLDGFDLGIGILFPFTQNESERDQMTRSIAPYWDGNETWLVLGGAGLFVAFPKAYAVIMPAFYLPVIVMLLALVFRGIAFEFRHVSRSKTGWNFAFAAGSTLATFAQGVILGSLIQGVSVRDGAYSRRLVRLGNAVRVRLRAFADRWLRLARRNVARDENRRAGCRTRACARQDIVDGGARIHGRREFMDAAHRAPRRGTLVLVAEFLFPVAGTRRHRTDCLS